MKALIIGAGAMGRAAAWNFRKFSPFIDVIMVDNNTDAFEKTKQFLGKNNGIQYVKSDASNYAELAPLFKEADVALGASSYKHHYELCNLALENHCHWIDLGGNNDVVRKQFALHDKAVANKVSIVPDSGLAPGMVNVLSGGVFAKMETVDSLQIRVGGLPKYPTSPLQYGLLFSPEGLINEYVEPALHIENGKLETSPSLTGLEKVFVGAPFGTLEAFHTSGGASTMVETYLGKINTLNYKTLRYSGHCSRVKMLSDLGFFSSENVVMSGQTVSPRKVTEALLEKTLGWAKEDYTVVKVTGSGIKDGQSVKVEYNLIDEMDTNTGLTSMGRCTAFPACAIARMILSDDIEEYGVLRQEVSVNTSKFIKMLNVWGINITSSQP